MNTAHLSFHQGCPMNDWTPISDWTELNFSVVNIDNKLYIRCDETHETINSIPNAKSLFDVIKVYWRAHFKSKGYSSIECDVPKNESQKELYRIYRLRRTLLLKEQLIKAGVLKK